MYTLVELSVSVGLLITLITALSACICGCKNSNQKSELIGTAGVVKIRLDEEAPSPTPTTPASVKRASTQNSQRSLPEIPHLVGRHDSGDTASEIYATVNLDESNKAAVTASTSRESRDHPYDHPYAKVQSQTQNDSHNITVEIAADRASDNEIQIDERDASTSGPESVVISASVAISGQLPSSQELPYITPPSPRPDNAVHFSGDSTDSAKGYTSISVREPLSNIRAQSTAQPHYATVSDDSDEMYAAIEEAAAGSDTYAQIAPAPRRPRDSQQHAPQHAPALHADIARRSAPPEVGATTTCSTLTRQASSTSFTNSAGATTSTVTTTAGAGALGSPKPEKRSANSPLPPPPHSVPHSTANRAISADQRHQRISSTGDLFAHDKLRRSLNEKHQRNNSCVSSSDFYGCNYPVEKHRFSSGDPLIRPLVAKELNFDIDKEDPIADNLYNSIDGPAYSDYSSEANASKTPEQRITESPSRNVEEMYAKVMKRSKGKADESVRRSKDFSEREAQKSKYRSDDPGYETIDRKKTTNDGYETIARKERKTSNQDPGYETVKEINKGPNSNFNNNLLKLNMTDSGPSSLISSDPGYEHISKNDNNASDSDPNYEVLRNQPPTPPYATIAPNYKIQPTYSTVNKRPSQYSNWPANNNDDGTEPNYESMPHEPLYTTGSESDPNYESVRPKDPNYESLRPKDPNYESVRTKDPNYESVGAHDPNYESLRSRDPKYESVRSKDPKYDSVRSRKDPNYESVKYFEVSKKEPPYEKLKSDSTTSSSIERSDSSAGYEKINVPSNRDSKSSISNGTDANVSDYFQV